MVNELNIIYIVVKPVPFYLLWCIQFFTNSEINGWKKTLLFLCKSKLLFVNCLFKLFNRILHFYFGIYSNIVWTQSLEEEEVEPTYVREIFLNIFNW